MKKCLLHIGTEKTGTTAIQSFFSVNSKVIKENTGLYYPILNSLCNGLINHNSLPTYAQDNDKFDHLRMHCNIHDLATLIRFREDLLQKLTWELSDQNLGDKIHTVILSCEHCHSRLITESEVDRLAQLLRNFFDSITIIVYLRIQDEMALSAYSTAIKSGGCRQFILPPTPSDYFCFDKLLLRWSNTFGAENIIVRIYRQDLLLNGDVVNDFAAQVGLTNLQSYKITAHQNESLSVAALEYLRLCNKGQPPAGHIIERPTLLGLLNKYFKGKGPTPRRHEVEAFARNYVEGNAFVEKNYLHGYPSDVLKFDFEKYPEQAPNENVTEEKLIQIGQYLWSKVSSNQN